MKISKIFFYLNFLFVINLLILHIRAENDLNLSEDPLVKLERELTREKRKKRIYLYILISIIALSACKFTFKIFQSVYKRKTEELLQQKQKEASLYHMDQTTPPYKPTPFQPTPFQPTPFEPTPFPSTPDISPIQSLLKERVDKLVEQYDKGSSIEKTAQLRVLREQNNLDPSKPYKGMSDGSSEVRLLATMFFTKSSSSATQ